MNYLLKICFLSLLLVLPVFFINAQEEPPVLAPDSQKYLPEKDDVLVYIRNVVINDQSYRGGDTLTGSFDILTANDFDVSNIYYKLTIQDKLDGFETHGVDFYRDLKSESLGPISLKAKERRNIPFSIKIPENLGGSINVNVVAFSNNVILLGEGKSSSVDLIGGEQFMVIVGGTNLSNGESYGFQHGPTIYENKEPKTADLVAFLGSYDKETISVYPEMKIRRLGDPNEILYSLTGDPLNVEVKTQGQLAESDEVRIALPTFDYEPGVYVGELIFKSETTNLPKSEVIEFRYIVGGAKADISSVISDKSTLKRGEEFSVTLEYIGQAFDIGITSDDEKQDIADMKTNTTVTVYNEKDQVVARKDVILDYNDLGDLAIDLKAERRAKALRIEVTSKIGDDEILKHDSNLSADYDQVVENYKNRNWFLENTYSIIGTVIFVFLLIAGLVLRKNKKGFFKIMMIALVILGGLFAFDNREALAAGCSYFYVSTSVSSPMQQEVFQPGESFNITWNVSTVQCMNTPLQVYATIRQYSDYANDVSTIVYNNLYYQLPSCNGWNFCSAGTSTYIARAIPQGNVLVQAPTEPGTYAVRVSVQVVNGGCGLTVHKDVIYKVEAGEDTCLNVEGKQETLPGGFTRDNNDILYTYKDLVSAGIGNWLGIASSEDGRKLAAAAYGGNIRTSIDSGNTWKIITSPGVANWYDIKSSLDGTKLTTAAYGGYIYTSSDSGNTWQAGTGSGVGNWQKTAISSDGTRLAAANWGGYVTTSTNSGSTWSTKGGVGNWRALSSSSDGTKLAAGAWEGYIYTSTDSGNTWKSATGSGNANWTYTASSEDGTKLATVAYGGYIYTSNDSGATWTAQTSAGSRNWLGIASSSDGTKLAANVWQEYIYTSNDSGATWTQRTSAGARGWQNIASSSDGTKLAATEWGGYIYTSADSGATWTQRTSSGARAWRQITSSSDGTKLAATTWYGYIYTSADSGATWTQATGVPSTDWWDITSSSDGTKLAAAPYNSNYIYTSNDSGATWTQRTSAGNRVWRGLSYSSDGTKLVATAQNGYVYTSTDSGATWTERTGSGARNWYSIASSGDGTKLVMPNVNGYIYTSNDSGVTWKGGAPAGLWHSLVSSEDGTKLAAAIWYGYIYTSNDSGLTWIERTSAGSRAWREVTSSPDGTRLAATDHYGYIYTSNDSGATWTARTSAGSRNWWPIALSPDGTKLVAGAYGGYIYTSNDSGATWTERRGAGVGNWTDITLSPDGTNIVVSPYGGGYVYASTDSGATWTQKTNLGSRNWLGLESSLDGTKLILGNVGGYIYTSNDSGDTWQSKAGAPVANWHGIAMSSDGTKQAATAYGNYIYTSTDSGLTWEARTSAGARNWRKIDSSSDGTKLAATNFPGYIYTSNDSGATWTERTSAGSRNWYGIALSSDGTKLAAGTWGGYIYTSNDFGATWTELRGAGTGNWAGITLSPDGTRLVAVNNAGYIYISTDSGATWKQQTDVGSRSWFSVTSSPDATKILATTQNNYIYSLTGFGKCIALQDVCPNVDGEQETLPEGLTYAANGDCVTLEVSCNNIGNYTNEPMTLETITNAVWDRVSYLWDANPDNTSIDGKTSKRLDNIIYTSPGNKTATVEVSTIGNDYKKSATCSYEIIQRPFTVECLNPYFVQQEQEGESRNFTWEGNADGNDYSSTNPQYEYQWLRDGINLGSEDSLSEVFTTIGFKTIDFKVRNTATGEIKTERCRLYYGPIEPPPVIESLNLHNLKITNNKCDFNFLAEGSYYCDYIDIDEGKAYRIVDDPPSDPPPVIPSQATYKGNNYDVTEEYGDQESEPLKIGGTYQSDTGKYTLQCFGMGGVGSTVEFFDCVSNPDSKEY